MPDTIHLPSVERWWPHLGIPAKQWLIAHLDETIPAWIVEEICALCDVAGMSPDSHFALSPADRGYIVTQTELVD